MSGATKGGWVHGSTIGPDGTVRFLSVSSMQKAELCLRRWLYHYKFKLQDEATDATRRGVAKHKEVEKYLRTGSRAGLSSQVLSGMFMIPEPGPDLQIEHDLLIRPGIDLAITAENSPILLRDAPLTAGGIAITGAIDLKHARGTNKGTNDITQMKDPPGTREVIDWKFTGNMNNAKSGPELLKTIQMPGYGKYIFNTDPDAKLVRLSHGYMPVKGRPAKMTILVDRDQIERAWESVDVLAGSIRDAAKETNPDLVDANTRSCRAFGKDCPAKAVCKAAGHDSLSEVIGLVAARDELEIEPGPGPGESPKMASLAEQLRAKKNAAANKEPTKDVKAEMLKIAQDEANAKFPDLNKVMQEIEDLGCGYPQLNGEIAKARGLLAKKPYDVEGEGLSGAGELGEYACESVEELQALLEEAKSLLAGDEGATTETKPETKVEEKPETTVEAAADAIADAAAEPKPKSKKKDKKKDTEAKVEETKVEEKPETVVTESSGTNVATTAPKFYMYVNAYPSTPFTSYWPVVFSAMNHIAEKLSKEEGKTIPDPRLADPNGKAGFGKWKVLLSTYLKMNEIPTSGHHVLDGSLGEVEQEVVRAMREICEENGGLFVMGPAR